MVGGGRGDDRSGGEKGGSDEGRDESDGNLGMVVFRVFHSPFCIKGVTHVKPGTRDLEAIKQMSCTCTWSDHSAPLMYSCNLPSTRELARRGPSHSTHFPSHSS